MTARILDTMTRRGAAAVASVYRHAQRCTRPVTGTLVGGTMADVARTKAGMIAENTLLRLQLVVLQRQVTRPAFRSRDRVRLVLLARLTRRWPAALLIVQPETLLRWHRQGLRLVWCVRSATARKRLRIALYTVAWKAERIRGQLLKRGIRVGKRTVQRHRRGARPPRRSGQTWATVLHNHAPAVWACDFLPVIDVGFRPLYTFFIVERGARRVVHVGVTRHPTDAWVAQQLRAATPFGAAPRFLIRDNDAKCGAPFARVAATTRIEILRTPLQAPRANAICERFLGSVRRACLDHLILLHERQLYRLLRAYCPYVNTARPHQGRQQAIPDPVKTAGTSHTAGASVRAIPVLGGLHHDYQRAA